jgi:3-hydroxyisobutyrate dehydrogenase
MTRIGWIGTGIMGEQMCRHVLGASYPVTVYNRTPSKTDDLVREGALFADSPRAVAEASEVVFTIVGYPDDVREVYFGESGLLEAATSGHIFVDMTTSEPSLAQEISGAAEAAGAAALDAPVSGGDVGAREGTLAIMAGGEQRTFETVKPIFTILGENVRFMGPAGAGQHTKMANQTLIASTMVGVVESLLYAHRSGLDLHEVIDVIGKGAASSWSINNLGRRIADRDYEPGFLIKHFVKDMGIALAEARRLNLSLPGLSLAQQFYVAAMAQGGEDLGTQGLYKVLARLNDMHV